MTWTLSSIAISPTTNPNFPGLVNLVRTVTMTFSNLDTNGVSVATHAYTEPNVGDVSPTGIAKLCRDQMAQLQRISDSTATLALGTISDTVLASIRSLVVNPPTLPPATVTAIRAVADFTRTDQQIADALNVADQPNPVTAAPLVDPPMNVVTLMSLLTADEQVAIGKSASFASIASGIQAAANTVVHNLTMFLAATSVISTDSAGKILAAVAPIADPAWSSLVSRAALALGRSATSSDVAIARALGS